jgi:hypothetical protein
VIVFLISMLLNVHVLIALLFPFIWNSFLKDWFRFIIKIFNIKDSTLLALDDQLVYGTLNHSLAEEIFLVFTINLF